MNRRTLLRSLLAATAAGLATARIANGAPGVDLAGRARRLLADLPSPELQDFLALWPRTGTLREPVATSVPVVRYLPECRARAPLFSQSFIAAVAREAPRLAWRRSYTEAEVGAAFFDNYGWTELVGLTGPVPSGQLACGVLLLGPQSAYPPHHHEADEIYVPLSGSAQWRQGSHDWEWLPPGSVIHNLRNESHAMRTATEPLFALYLWRSRDLDQKSRLDAAGAPG